MKNLGFISKRKVAIEITKLHNELERQINNTDNSDFKKQDWYAQSVLTLLCRALNIEPPYLSVSAGGVKNKK